MSPREKKLLILFGAAGFIVLNFLGINYFNSTRLEVERKRGEAEMVLQTAEAARNMSAEVVDEREWLAEHEPEPAAYQDVQTTLQQFVEGAARSAGLTIKSQKLLPTDTSGTHYHRAKVQLNVTGTEEALYRQWLDQVNDPEALRSATYIRLSPNSTDDTKIDCIVTIEQWFVPADT